jgi:diguanylate cyclase (GGDEF)-like protein
MKMIEFPVFSVNDDLKPELIRIMLYDNLRRCRIFAGIIILFESVLVFASMVTAFLKVDPSFQFSAYIIMYTLMIMINVVFFFLLPNQKTLETKSTKYLLKLENIMILYMTLILCWGSVISLMDQTLYGQLMVFMVNMLTLSVICQLEYKKLLLPYFISIIILAAGLPFFQPSGNVLFGHYINLTFFVIISWLASRMIYFNSCSNIQSGLLLKKSNIDLEKQIEQNKLMNSRLNEANLQLKKLSLVDELTGIPNRRSFRNFIDLTLENNTVENQYLAVIMIDIDYFKQFNDNYGHNSGDAALVSVARVVLESVNNPLEFCARWGGEEFIYIFIHEGNNNIAEKAEEIRKNVQDLKITHAYSASSEHLSISLGISSLKVLSKSDITKTIEMADQALYQAKKDGRNCARMILDK